MGASHIEEKDCEELSRCKSYSLSCIVHTKATSAISWLGDIADVEFLVGVLGGGDGV